MKRILIALFVMVLLGCGCQTTTVNGNQFVVTSVSKHRDEYKYIVTVDYRQCVDKSAGDVRGEFMFTTNTSYNVGDTLVLCNVN